MLKTIMQPSMMVGADSPVRWTGLLHSHILVVADTLQLGSSRDATSARGGTGGAAPRRARRDTPTPARSDWVFLGTNLACVRTCQSVVSMKVVITGGCGFIGQVLAREILQRGEPPPAAPSSVARLIRPRLIAS